MKLVDAHHHLWCPQSDEIGIDYQWLTQIGKPKPFGDPTPIQRDYLANEFLAESSQHTICASVHVQCDGAIADPVKESEWLNRVSQNYQRPDAQVGFIDLTADTADKTIEQYLQFPGFRGVRQILSKIDEQPSISFASEDYLINKAWQSRLAILAEHDLSFDLQCYPQQLSLAAEVFARQPGIRVVIDHAASPYDQSRSGLKTWRDGLKQISLLPQCHIKLSGFGMFDANWNAQSIQPLFDTIIELFSPQRVMFGSNFPVDKLMCDYDFIVNQLVECANNSGLDESDIQTIFTDTARRFYRLD